MFAVRRLSFVTIFTTKATDRKYHYYTTAGLLCCLLASLSTLATAEETVSIAEDTVAPATEAPATAEPTQESGNSEKPQGSVARAIFTSAIVDREPSDNLVTVSNDITRVFFFSDLRDLAGQIVTHRWEYNGKVMAEVTFKVGNGARWRVYSSKNLLPEWTGQWTVVVSNESGQPLKASMFEYSAPSTDKATATDENTATTSR